MCHDIYVIRVRGHLPDRWARAFSPLVLSPLPDGCTELRGRLPDQAALRGLLQRVGDLGLDLVSVACPQTRVVE